MIKNLLDLKINDTVNDTGIWINSNDSVLYEVTFDNDDIYEVSLRVNGTQQTNSNYTLNVDLVKNDSFTLTQKISF